MNETLFDVKGMNCGACVRHIQGALGPLPGVKEIDVRLREGRVRVTHDAQVDAATLTRAIEGAGYEAQPRP